MKIMFPIYSLSSNQTTPRPISPRYVAIEHNAYLYLKNINEQILGIEMMFDQGEKIRQAAGKIIRKCVKQPGKSSTDFCRQVFGLEWKTYWYSTVKFLPL